MAFPRSFDRRRNFVNSQVFMSSMNNLINEEYNDLPSLYWISRLCNNPYRERHITSSSTCSTKELLITMTKFLSAVKEGLQSYCYKVYSRSNINQIWILKKTLKTFWIIIPTLNESRGYIGILMSVRPSHFWFPDNN